MPFFTYDQNNSGGFNMFEKGKISRWVIIEAATDYEADFRAEEIGLYFNGEDGCECCGPRWCEAYGEGDKFPSIYGEPLSPGKLSGKEKPDVYVHYLNGVVEAYDR